MIKSFRIFIFEQYDSKINEFCRFLLVIKTYFNELAY